MGSLVHSRECGKATAVSVTCFHSDLVAELENVVPGARIGRFLYCCSQVLRSIFFTAVEGPGLRSCALVVPDFF